MKISFWETVTFRGIFDLMRPMYGLTSYRDLDKNEPSMDWDRNYLDQKGAE